MFVILSMNLHIHQQRRLSKVNPTGYQEARGPGIVLASWTLTCHCGQYTTCFSGLGRNGNQAQWLQQFSEKSSEEVTPCWARYWGPRMTVQRGQKQLEAPGESQTPQDGLKAGKRLRKSDGPENQNLGKLVYSTQEYGLEELRFKMPSPVTSSREAS